MCENEVKKIFASSADSKFFVVVRIEEWGVNNRLSNFTANAKTACFRIKLAETRNNEKACVLKLRALKNWDK